MNVNGNLGKSAQWMENNKELLAKYLKAGLGAGVLASGLGLAASRMKAKKEHSSLKLEDLKNAITVDIRKDKFMEGLPTPEEFAASKGNATATGTVQTQMSPEEIAAKKKEIIRNGRKVDFFGLRKAAAPKSEVRKTLEKAVGAEGGDDSGKKDGKGASEQPRDAGGRFVSPTSPIAAFKDEKSAQDSSQGYDWLGSIANLFAHPVKTGKGIWDSATGRPIAMAAGGVGALYLSAMIVDKVNEMRAKSSKRSANAARQEYVKLLQGSGSQSEKSAAPNQPAYSDQRNPFSAAGTLLGASFVVPAVLSAIITNKIMERRRDKDKKAKSMSSSFPEEPIIMYKTSEDKEFQIKPETAFALIMLKQAMADMSDSMEKSASGIERLKTMFPSAANAVGKITDKATDGMYDAATNSIIGALGDKKNSGLVLNLAKAYQSGNVSDARKHMLSLGSQVPASASFAALNKDKVMRRIASDPRTSDILTGYINDDSNADWKAWREDITAKKLGNYFRKGSMLFNLLQWITNNFGIGKYFADKAVKDKLSAMGGQNQQAAAAAKPTTQQPQA